MHFHIWCVSCSQPMGQSPSTARNPEVLSPSATSCLAGPITKKIILTLDFFFFSYSSCSSRPCGSHTYCFAHGGTCSSPSGSPPTPWR